MSYLPTAEVARRLGVHHTTVARMANDGRLPAAVQGPGIRGAYLFDAETVAEFLNNRVGGPPRPGRPRRRG